MPRIHLSLLSIIAVFASPLSGVASVYAPPSGGGGGGGSAAGPSGTIQTSNGAGGFNGLVPGGGISTWLQTPSSANLRSALTDETGTGLAVFGTSPTITGLTIGNITGSTQCLHVNTSGLVSGTGADCPGGGGSPGGSSGQIQWNNGGSFDGLDAGVGLAVDTTNKKLNLTTVLADQTAGDYTVVATDAGKTLMVGGHTYTQPQAGSAGFPAGWGICFVNTSAADATIATTTSVFKGAGGASTLTLQPNTWFCPASNATDYVGEYAPSTFGIAASLPLFANGGGGIVGGTRTGNTTKVVTSTGALTTGNCAKWDASGNLVDNGATCGGGGGSPGGSSGDIQYNNAGAFGGRAPSGNGTTVVTTTGSQTSGKCVTIDANGNHVADANPCGGGGGSGMLDFGASGTAGTTNPYLGRSVFSTVMGARPIIVPMAMTVQDLVCLASGAPGAGVTHTFTLNVNGSDNTNQKVTNTGASQTIANGTNGGDANTPVALSRGDYLAIHMTVSSGTPAIGLACSLKFS